MLNDSWLDDVQIKGKPPRHKLEHNGKQIAQWNLERGGFSLSKASINLLGKNKSLREVNIVDDVNLKGDLHYKIIDSFDSKIKAGDYFLILQGGEYIGLEGNSPVLGMVGNPGPMAKLHQKI